MEGDYVKCSDITTSYMKAMGRSKKTSNNLGKLVKKAFPNVKRVYKRNSDGRYYIYMNLGVRKDLSDIITFDEIPGILEQQGTAAWSEADKGWVSIKVSPENIAGQEPLRQIIFKEDNSLVVRLGEYEAPLQKLDLPTTFLNKKSNIIALLDTIRLMQICNGYQFSDAQYRKSKKCHILINPISPKDRCICCKNRQRYERAKANEAAREKQAAQVQQDTDDSISLDKTNMEDIKDILARIDQKMADNPKMVELIESQKMAMKCRGPSGHRWPKR